MTKKNEKLLLGAAALIGTAIGCGIAYLNKAKKEEAWDEDFDEFQDEFDEDLDREENAAHREYVTIPKEPLDTAEEVKETLADAAEAVKETVSDITKEAVTDASSEIKDIAADAVKNVASDAETADDTSEKTQDK